MCRKAFARERVKKLHVDRLTGGGEDAVVDAEESELLQRVAMFFGENTPEEDVNAVLQETREWLATRPDTLNSVSPISLPQSQPVESSLDKTHG